MRSISWIRHVQYSALFLAPSLNGSPSVSNRCFINLSSTHQGSPPVLENQEAFGLPSEELLDGAQLGIYILVPWNDPHVQYFPIAALVINCTNPWLALFFFFPNNLKAPQGRTVLCSPTERYIIHILCFIYSYTLMLIKDKVTASKWQDLEKRTLIDATAFLIKKINNK